MSLLSATSWGWTTLIQGWAGTMGIETEAKLKVSSHDAIRTLLDRLGAEPLGSVLETNHIFDNPNRTLLASDAGLRVRRMRAITGPERPTTLTYKGPKRRTELKQREEIEVTVGDADAAQALLRALGFVEVLVFQKRRESWRLGDCHVELDELPHLGLYIEVEGPGPDQVRSVMRQLGLTDEPVILSSYIALLVDYCRASNLLAEQIIF